MGERETPEAAATTRSQSVVHHTERTPGEAARLVSTLLERGGGEGGLATLVIVPTIDDAIGLAESLVKRGQRGLVPITSQARGRRLLSTGPGAVAATASDLAAFVAESRLTLSTLQALAILWPEEIIDSEQNAALERVLGEVSKSAERLAVVSQRSDELNKFIERTMWRARNIDHVAPAPTSTAAVRVLAAAPVDRLRALRTVLDAYDPPSAVLLTFSEESEAAAHDAAAVLGANGNLVSVRRGVPDERFSLSIIFDGVPGAEELDAAAAGTSELVAIVSPARLAAFNKVATGATPLVWTGAIGNARSVHDALRDEIRAIAAAGAHLPWVPLLEPLLEGLDAVDVAAASLSLVERERRRSRRAPTTPPVAAPAEREARPEFRRPPERDDRRGDRPERSFSRPRDAGARSSGFRKRDDDRPGGFRKRDDRPGGFRKRDDDPRRGGGRDRPDRGRPDRGRPERGAEGRFRDAPRDRGARPDDIERMPRAAHEGREWSERGERLKHSRRGPRRDEGGA